VYYRNWDLHEGRREKTREFEAKVETGNDANAGVEAGCHPTVSDAAYCAPEII
jgi:hypothetical protein